MEKKVLIVISNPSIHPTLNYPVGFWASELYHPIEVFNKQGITWDICSPDGGKVEMDAFSNPDDPSKYSAWDVLSKKYIEQPEYLEMLEDTVAIKDIDLNEYDAIMVAGGQSPMFTFEQATDLHEAFAKFYNEGKIASALCHGVAVLNFIKDENGELLIKGKKVTGFTNEEEDAANAATGAEVMPWRIEEALTGKGIAFEKAGPWEPFAIADGNLITGQQNMSGEATAKKIAELLYAS